MVTYNTTTFVNSVKNVAHVPIGNNTFSNAQILSLGDMQMRTLIAPKIAACRENYWLTTFETPTDADVNKYPIPSKAQGSAIVDVKVNISNTLIHLTRLEIGDLYSLDYSVIPAYGYYIQDHYIRLNPNHSLNGTLTMWYYRIPSQLVPVSSCGQITTINYSTGAVTVATLPTSFVGSDIELDIVSQSPGFNVLVKDSVPSNIAGNVITFGAGVVPHDVSIGDYVCLSGQSCVVQCPLEWVEVLVQATAVKIYEIQGYDRKMAVAKKILDEMVLNATNLVSPRTVESPKVIYGGGSFLWPQSRGWIPSRRD